MDILKNKKGSVMPLVLIVLTISVIFGFTSLSMMDSQSKFNTADDSGKKAIEYAEAGYNYYLWHLNDNVNFYSTTESEDMQGVDIPFMDGFYRLEVTKPSDTDRFITIKSTGWAKGRPETKRTIEAKIRKKQFVHYVYVSDNDGKEIWWTSGDESHGPYHTNKDFYTTEGSKVYNNTLGKYVYYPVFFDTVSYSGSHTESIRSSYRGDAYLAGEPKKVGELVFPQTNSQMKAWAQKDNMVFYGRTCIYLDGENIKIRNGNAASATTIPQSSIKNGVIYVDKAIGGGTGKFDLKTGNIFISGTLKGTLTIAAANDIYITWSDPTNWYDYSASDLNNISVVPNQPPKEYTWAGGSIHSYPEFGGIEYYSTAFTPSYKPSGKDYYIREASGKDMLGLVANSDIFILHYGWPKMSVDGDKPYWNFEWIKSGSKWVKSASSDTYYDVAPKEVTIHSAVFAVNGGFGFESYRTGDRRGDITLWGNITQKIRQAVGTIGSTGYNKKYSHDARMFYDYPPHILEPANVGWEIHSWSEIN